MSQQLLTKEELFVLDLVTNLQPEFTSTEIREALFNLERNGILRRQAGNLVVDKTVKKLAQNYFEANRSQWFKDYMIGRVKKRTRELTSNLYYIGLVKRLLIEHSSPSGSQTFLRVPRSEIVDVKEEDLEEAAKLGLILVTENEILVATDVLTELESIFRTSLSEESFIIVHSGNSVEMNIAWKTVFESCRGYVKIQDEYIDETTLDRLYTYLVPNVRISILSSIVGARELSLEGLKDQVSRIRSRETKIEMRFVGYLQNDNAPFHQRYVISKDSCFLISHSIKDVGKSKEATIVALTPDRKNEVEAAFDYWYSIASDEVLSERRIRRWDYGEWINKKK